MSDRRVLWKGKFCWFAAVLVGLSGLSTFSCRASKEVGTFYLRSCETGRLIGPIHLTPGHPLPPLDEDAYVVANPAESELGTRKLLLDTNLYENHYSDFEVVDVIETIRQMLKHRLGDKAPPVRTDSVDALITMEITGKEVAYDVLFNIAAQAQARILIEDGAVILSRRKLREIATSEITTNDMVARRGRPSR